MKLTRFEGLGLLPKKEPFTVWLIGAGKAGNLLVSRRRVSTDYLLENVITENPWFDLVTVDLKPEYQKAKSLGAVVRVGYGRYVKAAPHKVKRFLAENNRTEIEDSYTFDEEKMRAKRMAA